VSEDVASQINVELSRVAAEVMATGTQAEWLVGAGEPAHEILCQLQQQRAELIVMRTRGRAGLRRAVAGSVADAVLANSSVPVLLLRSGGHRLRQIRRLFVPVDGSPGGAAALGTATKLAEVNGEAIHLFEAVVPLMPFAAAYDGMMTSAG
jgi:nucleotide-binding universal stress UspA family protein